MDERLRRTSNLVKIHCQSALRHKSEPPTIFLLSLSPLLSSVGAMPSAFSNLRRDKYRLVTLNTRNRAYEANKAQLRISPSLLQSKSPRFQIINAGRCDLDSLRNI